MVSIFQAIILSIVQGITEWLPISSSGHLALFQNFFGFQNLAFDVFLHLASVLAIFIIFRKDILSLLNLRKKENLKYLLLIIIAILPAGVVGFLFRHQIENLFSNMFYLGIFFMVSGILIYTTKYSKEIKRSPSYVDSLIVGCFQAIAILPGISRSGATISSGLFRGIKREQALKFSSFMAIPVILGAGIFELKDTSLSRIDLPILIVSFIVTFIVSVLTIKFLLKIIKGHKFYLFGIYNFILGLCVLIVSFFR